MDLDTVLKLAKLGLEMFPCLPNSKKPAIADFPNKATCNPEQLKKWFQNKNLNVGISTSRYKDGWFLLVVDIDNKGDKKGDDEVLKLELEGKFFPKTLTQNTPTGGKHLIYKTKVPVKQGVSVLGPGLDIRAKGGYVVAASSTLDKIEYTIGEWGEIIEAPEWLVDSCTKITKTGIVMPAKQIDLNQERVRKRCTYYLQNEAPIAMEGNGGDHITYVVACTLKDLGADLETACELMAEHWNERCSPPWEPGELVTKVQNAFAYGVNPPGVKTPEADFSKEETGKELSPIEKMNEKYAMVVIGDGLGIIWEDKKDNSHKILGLQTFKDLIASELIQLDSDKKPMRLADHWLRHPNRRTYHELGFFPNSPCPPTTYNMFKGFKYKPLAPGEKVTDAMKDALSAFKEHLFENVCNADESLATWLTGYFAHLLQRPWEKALTALVFKGRKGVGKNSLLECVGPILGSCYMVTSDRNKLIGRFNSFLENNLLLVLDEAYWSGDKSVEGKLKGLITGKTHWIERKGHDCYEVLNYTRVAIISNEDWVVPATEDERRYAVFTVGEKRIQDIPFFKKLNDNLLNGGYRYILTELLNFDLSAVNVNAAPKTEGLSEQILESLGRIEQFWLDCLTDGKIHELTEDWPGEVKVSNLYESFLRDMARKRVSYPPSRRRFVVRLKSLCPTLERLRIRKDYERSYILSLPPLDKARAFWTKTFGLPKEWD